jgi:hypothetical protein
MKINTLTFILLINLFAFQGYSQDLEHLFDDSVGQKTVYTEATFKATRLVTGHSVENPANGTLLFLLSHRFGQVNLGWYELWGLDQATMRFGFEYGVNDFLSLGFGRSTWEKTYDGFLKAKLLRQSTGRRNMPVTLTAFASTSMNTMKWEDPDRENYTSSRFSYAFQALIARKFTRSLSLQLMPSMVHHNLVPASEDHNDIFSLGAGGRIKLNPRMSFNAEYYYTFPGQVSWEYQNCFSFGFDVETGGHVFQLVVTNTQAQFEQGFLTKTTGKWSEGDIYFGFNLSRVFTIKKPKEFRE